jgi:hypothetical protein
LTVFDGRLYFSADNGYVPTLGNLQPKIFYVAPVPEPATCLLFAATLLCGWIAIRRRADHANMH